MALSTANLAVRRKGSTGNELFRILSKLTMLTLSGITKAYGGRVLFADATLQVNREDRIGLVGPNGAGKSTLFSIILGEESADEGETSMQRGVTMGYLAQETAPVGDETILELATAIT